jgi:chaperonin GroEL
MRVDDAVNATRAAAQEGIVPGGGIALVRAARALDRIEETDEDVLTGVRLLRRAMEEPLRRIAENAGVEGAIVSARVEESKGKLGYNAATGIYEDLAAAGIIDPTKVVRTALQNAASVAGILLTTDAAVTEAPEPKRAATPPMPGGEDYDF